MEQSMKYLHILNGDATYDLFRKTALAGDTLVWREILCEGPTVVEVGSDAYWKVRGDYLISHFPEGAKAHLAQFQKELSATDLRSYDEVVLWFEHDLFCQINLLAVLNWLKESQAIKQQCSWVRVDQLKDYRELTGLGEINPADYPALLESRQQFEPHERLLFAELWELYCSSNQHELVAKSNLLDKARFPYLSAALEKHGQRFPSTENGLSELEEALLQTIASNSLSERQLVGKMLSYDRLYGFGDLQYFNLLRGLQTLFYDQEDKLVLNSKGQDLLNGRAKYQSAQIESTYYGGACRNDFVWEPTQQQLLPRGAKK